MNPSSFVLNTDGLDEDELTLAQIVCRTWAMAMAEDSAEGWERVQNEMRGAARAVLMVSTAPRNRSMWEMYEELSELVVTAWHRKHEVESRKWQ